MADLGVGGVRAERNLVDKIGSKNIQVEQTHSLARALHVHDIGGMALPSES